MDRGTGRGSRWCRSATSWRSRRLKWSGRGLAGEWADGRLHETPTLSNMAQNGAGARRPGDGVAGAGLRPDRRRLDGGNIIAVQGWARRSRKPPASGQTLRRYWIGHRPATTTMRNQVGICFVGGADWQVVTSSITRGQHCDHYCVSGVKVGSGISGGRNATVQGDCWAGSCSRSSW